MKNEKNVKANESKKNAQVAEAKKPQAKKPVAETKPQVKAPVEAPKPKAKKPTKEQVIKNLNAMTNGLAKMSKNKVKGATELLNRVVNAVGNSAKTKVDDLIALNDEVIQFGKDFADSVTKKTVVENAIKPKAATKTAEKKASSKKSEKTEEKPLVSATKEVASILPTATMFPEKLEVKDLGTLVRANAKYKNSEEIAEALENGTQFYFATYWTARHIAQFNYGFANMVPTPKSFPNDLDILEPVYYCENVKRIWAASLYTEAMFNFNSEDITPIEDTNPYSGEKFAVRVSNGMEFELYELAPVAETKKATKK